MTRGMRLRRGREKEDEERREISMRRNLVILRIGRVRN